jgi:hypothetical protein
LANGETGLSTSIQSFTIQGTMDAAASPHTANRGRSMGFRAFESFHAMKPTAYGTAKPPVYFTA